MLDISRGRVPRLETLLGLVEQLADFKFNEFQLYTEHTSFAYRNYRRGLEGLGRVDRRGKSGSSNRGSRCRQLGIELVPNAKIRLRPALREWLADSAFETAGGSLSAPWTDAGGAFLRHPATLAPTNPGTMPFLRGLAYDELLPELQQPPF